MATIQQTEQTQRIQSPDLRLCREHGLVFPG